MAISAVRVRGYPCGGSSELFESSSVSSDPGVKLGQPSLLRSRAMADEGASSMPVVNVHVAEATSGELEEQKAAEEGLARRQKLAELEEMALRNKELFLNALAATSRQIEKFAAVN